VDGLPLKVPLPIVPPLHFHIGDNLAVPEALEVYAILLPIDRDGFPFLEQELLYSFLGGCIVLIILLLRKFLSQWGGLLF
jgi:hypothetical protein